MHINRVTARQIHQLIQEVEQLESSRRTRNSRFLTYMPLFSVAVRNSAVTRSKLIALSGHPSIPSLRELHELYERITTRLNQKYWAVRMKTNAERRLAQKIAQSTRLEVFKSMWVGNHNVDFLILALGGIPCTTKPRYQALALEMEGGVHYLETKQKKDQYKERDLSDLHIGVHSIPNEDLDQTTVRELVARMCILPRTDSKTRARMKRNIYLETLFHHATQNELDELFGFRLADLVKVAPASWGIPK